MTTTGQRGVTLVELMITVAIMGIVMLSLMQFIITSTQQNRGNQERSEIVRGGQTALGIIAGELENAGLGIPRRLAIRRFDNPGVSAESCPTTPELEIVSLDLTREWVLTTVEAGVLAMDDPNPSGAPDTTLEQGQWLFFYKNATFDSATAINHGHGMVEVGATRNVGDKEIATGAVAFNWAQTNFDLDNPLLDNGAGHTPVVLRARTSRFGVDCTNAERPYLYWVRDGGAAIPLASYADTTPLEAASPSIDALAGDIPALRFRFHVDADSDGFTDDQNGDAVIDNLDLVAEPGAANPPADLSQVTAIEVQFRLRSLDVDSNIGRYRTQDFVHLVRLSNMNTRNPDYIFVDNTGL